MGVAAGEGERGGAAVDEVDVDGVAAGELVDLGEHGLIRGAKDQHAKRNASRPAAGKGVLVEGVVPGGLAFHAEPAGRPPGGVVGEAVGLAARSCGAQGGDEVDGRAHRGAPPQVVDVRARRWNRRAICR